MFGYAAMIFDILEAGGTPESNESESPATDVELDDFEFARQNSFFAQVSPAFSSQTYEVTLRKFRKILDRFNVSFHSNFVSQINLHFLSI